MDTNIRLIVCLCANKLNCKVQLAVFILIDRVKQNCQDGMRFRQNKLYPVLLVMRCKSGLFGSNIAQMKSITVIEMCCLQSLCTKILFNLSRSTLDST